MLIQIATLRITCSQFQQPSPTAATRGEAELRIYNLKKTSPPQSQSQAVVCVSTPRKYPRSGYFLVAYYVKKPEEAMYTHAISIVQLCTSVEKVD